MNDVEKAHLEEIRDWCRYASDGWNNAEVRSTIISRMIMLSSISNENFQYFLDRVFDAIVDGYNLSGLVDGMIATGKRNPQILLCCMSIFKLDVPEP
jgi:hypothetical protein